MHTIKWVSLMLQGVVCTSYNLHRKYAARIGTQLCTVAGTTLARSLVGSPAAAVLSSAASADTGGAIEHEALLVGLNGPSCGSHKHPDQLTELHQIHTHPAMLGG
jgi:hypothetical protein